MREKAIMVPLKFLG